jgi:hypothetical protein
VAAGGGRSEAEKLVRAVGISVNRWEPSNVLRALKTGLIDSVQVVYNVFDQAPRTSCCPTVRRTASRSSRVCRSTKGASLARWTRTRHGRIGDWRNIYFNRDHLTATLARVDRLKPLVPEGMDLPELALRFILEHRPSAPRFPACAGRRMSSAICRPATAPAAAAARRGAEDPPLEPDPERYAVARRGWTGGTGRMCCYNGGFPDRPRSTL